MIGQRLRRLRKDNHLTQEDMAKQLNIAKTTYASYEQDKRTPDAETQNKIADFFSVTLDYLHSRNDAQKWINKNYTYDLKMFLESDDGLLVYEGEELTSDEADRLRIALTQIFWNRHRHH